SRATEPTRGRGAPAEPGEERSPEPAGPRAGSRVLPSPAAPVRPVSPAWAWGAVSTSSPAAPPSSTTRQSPATSLRPAQMRCPVPSRHDGQPRPVGSVLKNRPGNLPEREQAWDGWVGAPAPPQPPLRARTGDSQSAGAQLALPAKGGVHRTHTKLRRGLLPPPPPPGCGRPPVAPA